MPLEWLPVSENEPALPGTEYLVELGPFPVEIPVELPDWITGPFAALFSTQGLWDSRFRGGDGGAGGDRHSLFISFRTG